MLPEATFMKIKVIKPSEIPSAIEKVRGIIIMIINDGRIRTLLLLKDLPKQIRVKTVN